MSQLALCGCCKNAMDAAEHNDMHWGVGREQYKEPKWPLAILGSSPPSSKPPGLSPRLRCTPHVGASALLRRAAESLRSVALLRYR